ncbi:MAG: GIY-YIG nuclease family protein [Chloroflexota bacterium]
MPFCYILECADGTFYTGWTTDLERRVKTHNAGRGATYTKLRRPVRLVYSEKLRSRSAAQKRELAIKRLRRSKKLELVNATRDTQQVRRSK